jgi:predicted RNA-binding protein Jag
MENSSEKSQKSKDVFLTMVGLLGLKTEVNDKISGKNIILSVSTDEPGRLIGRNGSSLDSVGLLMNRILKKEDIEFPKVIIDVDGYDKKSKRKRGGNRRDRSRRVEKTMVLQEEPKRDVDDNSINFYVEDDGDSLAPVTTVALNTDSNDRSNNRGRNNNSRGRNNNNRGRNNNNRGQNSRTEKPAQGENPRHSNRNRNRSEESKAPAKAPAQASAPAKAPAQASAPAKAPAQASAPAKAPAQALAPAKAPAQASAPAKAPAQASAPAKAPAQASAPAKAPAAPAAQTPTQNEKSGGRNERNSGGNKNRLQMQCRNAVKEVKRWGEDGLLPPMNEEECKKAVEYFSNDKDINAVIDSKSYGDKKRVRISLKKS